MAISITFILILIVLNGLFAASEMALMTARRGRIQARAEEGSETAAIVMEIQDDPGNFLATVQIGITLVGTLSGAVGGADLSRQIAPYLTDLPIVGPYASQVALGLVVVCITYLSLVVGELVPKQIALQAAERLSMTVVRPLGWLSRIAALPIRILDFSADTVVRLMGLSADEDEANTSEEDIEMMVRQAADEGVIEPIEERLIHRVFDYADRRAWDVITPRTKIVALEADSSPGDALRKAKKYGYSRFPVIDDNLDRVLGYVHVKDIIWADDADDLRPFIRETLFIPNGTDLPNAFSTLTKAGKHMAIVLDEYGGTQGLLTLEDVLEVIVGQIEDEHSPLARKLARQMGSEWMMAGNIPLPAAADVLKIDFPSRGMYATLAGFLLAEFGSVPEEGDELERFGYQFRVEEMERLRIAMIHVTRVPEPGEEDTAEVPDDFDADDDVGRSDFIPTAEE